MALHQLQLRARALPRFAAITSVAMPVCASRATTSTTLRPGTITRASHNISSEGQCHRTRSLPRLGIVHLSDAIDPLPRRRAQRPRAAAPASVRKYNASVLVSTNI